MPEPEQEIDCEGTDEVVCPYCGHEHSDSYELFRNSCGVREDITCLGCEKTFRARADYSVTYYSEKVPDA